MSTLRVSLVQQASTLDPVENLRSLDVVATLAGGGAADGVAEGAADGAAGGPAGRPDLVVFPEAFACDFGAPGTDISAYAEPVDPAEPDARFVRRLVELAAEHRVHLLAGMFERSHDPARPFNTLVLAGPEGVRATYRKIHLYDSFGYRESDRLSAGETTPVVTEIGGVRVGLMTCYDLRFPELARALVHRGADLLVTPAAWVAGERKVDHWRTLARARAIENTAYVAATGQPAPRYSGHSMLVDPMGDVLAEGGPGPAVVSGVVDTTVLEQARKTNPSLANRRF
ncbi:MAG TPA: carbon-nitrogen hydrolase family protein [Nocardioidaceae bacterium]|nr:carbon-nitrogen hydrolase family protein [Nocardioidaceae bacterium]